MPPITLGWMAVMISMPRSQWGEGVELNSCNEPGLCVSWCQSVSEVFPIVDLKGSARPECEDKTGGGATKVGYGHTSKTRIQRDIMSLIW